MKYSFNIWKKVNSTRRIDVEAASLEEAREKALFKAKDEYKDDDFCRLDTEYEVQDVVEPETEPENKALRDYQKMLGKTVFLFGASGYNERDDSLDLRFDPPVKFKVTKTPHTDICRWTSDSLGDWLDPYWNVEPVDKDDPQVASYRSFWIYGNSYRKTGEQEPSQEIFLVEL